MTIEEDNLLWLKAQAAASPRGSVSAVLDRLVADARVEGRMNLSAVNSVAGTIDLPADDPDLDGAASYVRDLFDRSLRRPILVKEEPPPARRPTKRRG